jgi:hypothetical protein
LDTGVGASKSAPSLVVVGLERLLPARIALGVGCWRLVAEEVEVERAVARGAEASISAQLLVGQHGAGQGAQAAGVATAMAMAEPLAPAMGAWRMGTSMFNRSRMRRSGQVLMGDS